MTHGIFTRPRLNSREGSSHELAGLLLTETIQHSLLSSKQPVFSLFVDARSAFDKVVREILVKDLYNSGTDGDKLLYLDERLKNRETYCDFAQELMVPL